LTKDLQRTNDLDTEFSTQWQAQAGKWSSRLPDFDVSIGETAANFEALSIPVTRKLKEGYHREHPLDLAAAESRVQGDVFSALKENELIFTNLPIGLSKTILESEATIVDHLRAIVHKDIDV